MIEPGQVIQFRYPSTTHVYWLAAREARFSSRSVLVKRVRDLVAEPLTVEEFLRRPYVRRSRWLITGIDQVTSEYRQFYLGCSPDFAAPSQLRLALYRAGCQRPERILFRPFGPTLDDRKELQKVAELFARQLQDDELQLRIFADDLRLVG